MQKRASHKGKVEKAQTKIIIITFRSDIMIIILIIVINIIMVTLWSSNGKRVPYREWVVEGQADIIIVIITSLSDIIIIILIIMEVIIMTIITMVTLWSSNVKRVPHREWVVEGQTDRSGMSDCTARSIKLPA